MQVWSNFVVAGGGGCTCCGGTTPCSCVLMLPPFAVPYVNYATANNALNDFMANTYDFGSSQYLGKCILFASNITNVSNLPTNFFGIYQNETDVFINRVCTPSENTLASYFSFNAAANSNITLDLEAYSVNNGLTGSVTVGYTLYQCDGAVVAANNSTDNYVVTNNATRSNGKFFGTTNIANAGEYVLRLEMRSLPNTNWAYMDWHVESSENFSFNPAVAQWTDGANTRQLWACPKLFLPPLTESTGDWYADCAAAADAITNNTSNCVGWFSSIPGTASVVATDGGSSLIFTISDSLGLGFWGHDVYGGINAEAGETISISLTGFSASNVSIFDDMGNTIEGLSGSGTLTSSPLPYLGRYTLSVSALFGGLNTSGTITITSSGTMSVNPIQALYDVGLDCPNRLNCGDSCP